MKAIFPSRKEAFFLSLVPRILIRIIVARLKCFEFFQKTRNTQVPISFTMWYGQKIAWHCADAYWPVHWTSVVSNPKNIYCGIETSPGYMPGNYIQAFGEIYVGDYTQIGPNVGIISANHDLYDTRISRPSKVTIGKYCWIGMGAIILPGVELGDFTIVGAGAVVTKSFEKGFCVLAGNPARVVRELDSSKCVRYRSTHEYNGYVPSEDFEAFRKSFLNI